LIHTSNDLTAINKGLIQNVIALLHEDQYWVSVEEMRPNGVRTDIVHYGPYSRTQAIAIAESLRPCWKRN
jgi:hypothetical protein